VGEGKEISRVPATLRNLASKTHELHFLKNSAWEAVLPLFTSEKEC